MKNLIMLDMAHVEEELECLFVRCAYTKELNLSKVYIEDEYNAYHENKPQEGYFLKYQVKDKNEEWLYLSGVHV